MLTCLPQSICSWNFHIHGASAGPVELEFSRFSEQGHIRLGSHEFEIHKHGPLSGRWTLSHHGTSVASAHKPSAFFRSFHITGRSGEFTLQPSSSLTRCFGICSGDRTIGSIRPAHAFTRRATIDCPPEVPELIQIFAFWLAVVTWRRAANNNS